MVARQEADEVVITTDVSAQDAGDIFEAARFLLGVARRSVLNRTKTHVVVEQKFNAETALIIVTCGQVTGGGIEIKTWGTRGEGDHRDGRTARVNYGTLEFNARGVLQARDVLNPEVLGLIKTALSVQRALIEQTMYGPN